MKPFFITAVPSLLAIMMSGCSGDSSTPACNDLAQEGSSLTVALASNPPPDPTGGTISDGTYVLNAARLFNVAKDSGTTAWQLGVSLEVKGDVIKRVSVTDGTVARSNFTYTISGTKLNMTGTCGSSGTETHDFIATPQLELLTAQPGTPHTLNQVFTKR